jgi:excisionase family DNA binding protein
MADISIIQISKEELTNIVSEAVQGELAKLSNKHNPQSSNGYLTREETAKLLKISLPTLDRYTEIGIIQGYRLGSVIRYVRLEVEASLVRIQNNKYRRIKNK